MKNLLRQIGDIVFTPNFLLLCIAGAAVVVLGAIGAGSRIEQCREWAGLTDAVKRCELDADCSVTWRDYYEYDKAERKYQQACLHLEDG